MGDGCVCSFDACSHAPACLLGLLQEAARNDHTEVVRLLADKGGCVWEEDKVRAGAVGLRCPGRDSGQGVW